MAVAGAHPRAPPGQAKQHFLCLSYVQCQIILATALLAAGAYGCFLFLVPGPATAGRGHGAVNMLLRHNPVPSDVSKAIRAACANVGTGTQAQRRFLVTGQAQRRYLVTGAAGFIGYHAALQLAARGDAVVGIDNFNDYYPVSLKRARAKSLLQANVHVVEADINDLDTLMELFQLCPFTHVLHLAAQAGVRYAARKPFTYVQSNIAGTVTILEVIKAQKPMPALVYASSSSVYGLSKRFPFTEDDRADIPASLYAATKRSTELIAHSYHNIFGMSVVGLRFFTVYGPWGRPDMSVMAFSRNIMDGKPIRVFQGPNQSELARDFTFVGDIVAGVMGALDYIPPSGKATAACEVFNLGNTKVVTVTEMVRVLEGLLQRKANVQYVPLGATGDVLRTNANITAARTTFGYQPHTDLAEGLAAFVEWYFQYYGKDGSKRPADEKNYIPD